MILDDKLGICASLEAQMAELVSTFFDEWAVAINNAEIAAKFTQFDNCKDEVENMEMQEERGQQRPVDWTKDSARTDFRNVKWTSLEWERIIPTRHFDGADEAPGGISASVKRGDTQLAVWRVRGRWLASQQMCPHKRAFVLSDGIIGDSVREKSNNNDENSESESPLYISCPNHKRNFELNGQTKGRCQNDSEVSIATFEAEERSDGWVWLKLPGVQELDGVLGMERWKVRRGESGSGCGGSSDGDEGGQSGKIEKGARIRGRKPGEAKRQEIKGEGSIDW